MISILERSVSGTFNIFGWRREMKFLANMNMTEIVIDLFLCGWRVGTVWKNQMRNEVVESMRTVRSSYIIVLHLIQWARYSFLVNTRPLPLHFGAQMRG